MDDAAIRKLARLLGGKQPSLALARLDAEKQAILREVVEQIVHDVRRIDVTDLWEQDQLANTYWILFMSGVDQEDEGLLARELLFWSTVFTKHSARVACIQSSDRNLFKYCTSYFNVKRWPTLIFSDRPNMVPFLSIDGQLLTYLSERRGGIRRLLTELHALVESGSSIQDIGQTIATEQFWKHLKLVYREAKTLVSVSIKAGSIDVGGKK